jgi:hypothetical protein
MFVPPLSLVVVAQRVVVLTILHDNASKSRSAASFVSVRPVAVFLAAASDLAVTPAVAAVVAAAPDALFYRELLLQRKKFR